MDRTMKLEHKCSIEAKVLYTSFEWSLHHWSILYADYANGITSPEFEIMKSDGCKCVLRFHADLCKTPGYLFSHTTMTVKFLKPFKFHSVQAKVSLIGNKHMERICAVTESRDDEIFQKPMVLTFDQYVNKELGSYYTVNNTLNLFFELNVVLDVLKSPVRSKSLVPHFGPIPREKLKELWETGILSDFIFTVEEETLRAHKIVLAANSDVFRLMFQTKMKEQEEGKARIDDADPRVFKSFLQYMYTGEVEGMGEIATDLIVIADKYQVTDLINACASYMMSNLAIENATQYLLAAHRLNLQLLEDEAVKFMKHNTHILADPAEYRWLSDYPTLITRIFSIPNKQPDDPRSSKM